MPLISTNANHASATGHVGECEPGDIVLAIAYSGRAEPRNAISVETDGDLIDWVKVWGSEGDRWHMFVGVANSEVTLTDYSGVEWSGGTPVASWVTATFRDSIITPENVVAAGWGLDTVMPVQELGPGQAALAFAHSGEAPFPDTQSPLGAWTSFGSGEENNIGAAVAAEESGEYKVTAAPAVPLAWLVVGDSITFEPVLPFRVGEFSALGLRAGDDEIVAAYVGDTQVFDLDPPPDFD